MDNSQINNNELNELSYKVNNIDKKKIIKIKKKYKSASLTFYNPELGYLMCEEYRYKQKKNLIHTIGGKVEDYDKDLLETAIREFMEETNLEFHPKINSTNLD